MGNKLETSSHVLTVVRHEAPGERDFKNAPAAQDEFFQKANFDLSHATKSVAFLALKVALIVVAMTEHPMYVSMASASCWKYYS